MDSDKWYRKIADRANYLNQDAPWIYSDIWLDMFLEDLDEAFEINDQNWIRELEESLD